MTSIILLCLPSKSEKNLQINPFFKDKIARKQKLSIKC